MLENIRQIAHHKLFKLFFFLLAVIFAVSLGDLGKSNNNVIASVGKEKISVEEFSKAKQATLNQLNQQQQLSPEQIQQEANKINQITLNNLISQNLINQELKHLGVIAPKEVIAEYVHKDQAFHKDGVFDLDTYKKLLEANNITEETLLTNLSISVSSKFLLNSLLINAPLKNNLTDHLYNYFAEKRIASIVNVDTSNINIDNSDAGIKDYYQKHQQEFQSNEYRSFSYLLLTDKNLKNNPSISETDLELEYKNNIDNYSLPETRDLHHFLTPDQETAKEILESLKQEQDHLKVAKEFIDKKVISEKFMNQPQQSFLSTLSPSIFELKENEVTDIIKSELGWHIFKITTINPKQYKVFAEVRKTVEEALKRKIAEMQLFELSKQVEDELASGSTFNEISIKYNLSLAIAENVAINGEYLNQAKANIDQRIIDTAFQISLNEDSSVRMLDNTLNLFVVKVDSITPPKLKEFTQVKKQVKELLAADTNDNLAAEIAKILQLEAAKEKQTLITADKSLNNTLLENLLKTTYNKYNLSPKNRPIISIKTQTIVRQLFGENKDLPETFVNSLFNLNLKKASPIYNLGPSKYVFAFIQKIELEKERNHAVYEQVTNISDSNYKNEIYEQYLDYLRNKYPVKLNLSLINKAND